MKSKRLINMFTGFLVIRAHIVIGIFDALCGLDGSRETSSDIFIGMWVLIGQYLAAFEILQDITPRSVDV